MQITEQINELENNGFSILSDVYSDNEIQAISKEIASASSKNESVIVSKDLYAIREFFIEIPNLKHLIFNSNLGKLLNEFPSVNGYFLSKAIYFDKPKNSNWFVPFHQDLTINVVERTDEKGFRNWTNKKGIIGVQPPTEFLERTITLRIHLDDTDEKNGALRIIPKSHLNGVVRIDQLENRSEEVCCEIERGGVMLMKPLAFHASKRSTGEKGRRVIHLEFCDLELASSLRWKEKVLF